MHQKWNEHYNKNMYFKPKGLYTMNVNINNELMNLNYILIINKEIL